MAALGGIQLGVGDVVAVGVPVAVEVWAAVAVGEEVEVGVLVGVWVGVAVGVELGVAVGVEVRLDTAAKRVGVYVYPHRLPGYFHQKFLGHKELAPPWFMPGCMTRPLPMITIRLCNGSSSAWSWRVRLRVSACR